MTTLSNLQLSVWGKGATRCSFLHVCIGPHALLLLLQVKAENERLRAAATAGRGACKAPDPGSSAAPGASVEATGAALHRQVKDFAATTQLDLQRQVKAWESRAVMAEEQLAHLQVVIAPAALQVCRAACMHAQVHDDVVVSSTSTTLVNQQA